MSFNRSILVLLSLALILIFGAATLAQDTTLTMLTHWGTEDQLAAQQAIIDAYMESNPGVNIELVTVDFGELRTKIITGRTAGISADVYHFYHLWLPDFVNAGVLDQPPEDALAYINENVAQGTIDAVSTSDGQTWGYPTEVNPYLLVYNKRLLAEAGYDTPPANWNELKEIAAAITQVDDTGAISQVGLGVMPGWDSGIVHPFSALLFSNGGNYLSADRTVAEFNSAQGIETLQLYADLVASGGTDPSINGLGNFPSGTVGMVIMAPWWRATLRAAEGVDFETEVRVAEIPVGPSGDAPSSIAYTWLFAVDSSSPNKEAAWDFIHWMNAEHDEGAGSAIGDFLVNALGAIPSFDHDQAAFAESMSDHYVSAFVAASAYARPEQIVAGGQEIKTLLQVEIEAVLAGMTTPEDALASVEQQANAILEEQRMMAEE
ncbi:MAG: sugar ABC transporter substrate-binding protein [Chloroflexi bacterium]|nr:sugar ABC transporter substrate-binding protein [Chloroflexota bacterium]